MIEYALDAGKHVFTDKPLGCSLEECKRAELLLNVTRTRSSSLALCAATIRPMPDAKAQINARPHRQAVIW